MMVEFIVKNVVIGGIIIVINLVPLLTRKYNILFLTIVISIILALLGIYVF